jgi:fructose-bisphosphate aldolase class II
MKTLREVLKDVAEQKVAIGHFNFSNLEGLWAIVRAAKDVDVPVILGLSEGERDFVGVKTAVALVKSIRDELNHPVFLNADHTYSVERAVEAARAGFDAVIYDGAKLSAEENIKNTKEAVRKVKEINPNILVEAELGYIGSSSKLLEISDFEAMKVELEKNLTTPEAAEHFVTETGIDLFAPAVGNLHGRILNMPNPRLFIDRVRTIAEKVSVPLVLHGGSGISDSDFAESILAGIRIVHINTEIREAFRNTLKETLVSSDSHEVAPYKFLAPATKAMQEAVVKRLRLFSHK